MFLFEFNSLDNCKCHSLWELADFVSFLAMSGTLVIFVACIYVSMFYLIGKKGKTS